MRGQLILFIYLPINDSFGQFLNNGDISKNACEPFGVYFGDRIETNLGNKATIIGTNKWHLLYIKDCCKYAVFGSREIKTKMDLEKTGLPKKYFVKTFFKPKKSAIMI